MKRFFTGRKSRKLDLLQDVVTALEKKLSISTRYLENIAVGKFEVNKNDFQINTEDEHDKRFYHVIDRTQEKLLEYARQEKEQQWTSDGLSQFMEVIKGDGSAQQSFYDEALSLLVKYTGANQGGLFLVDDTDESDSFLYLKACYAFGKKRFNQKRVDFGQGILGQCFLEGQTLQLHKVPVDYIEITSGLGEATPRFLLMVPLKYNDNTLGILELASFVKMEPYKVSFLERVADNLAAVIQGRKNAERVDMLYKESQEKALILQEKEESLRQNLEELVATQEEMKRQQLEVNRQSELMKFIIDHIPFPIFVKDDNGCYTLVNNAEARLFALSENEILGKNDSAFVSSREEWAVIKESDEKVLNGNKSVELPLQHFTTKGGVRYVFKTTKIPFLNPVTGKRNILGVSIDLTEKLDLEQQLYKKKQTTINNTLINLAGRQRMLSQKIAFHCEVVARGKTKFITSLQEAIALYEHSFLVIQHGGMPKGIDQSEPLPPAKPGLLPLLHKIEVTWNEYKTAALSILDLADKHQFQSAQAETHLKCIEEKSELLLAQNNELTQLCAKLE